MANVIEFSIRGVDAFSRPLSAVSRSLNVVGGSVVRATARFAKFGAIAAGVGLGAVAVAFTKAVNTAARFEEAVSDLSAITGAAGDDLAFLSEKAQAFGASTTLSATQAVEAFKLVASAKPDLLESGEALARVTREAITLSEAAGSALPEAARTLANSLNQFNASASQSTRFINVLAAGAKFGASEIAETSLALRDAGTVAAAAGLSFEEVNAAIQTLASVALKGSRAGVGFRATLLKLQNQAKNEFNPAIVGLSTALINLQAAGLSARQKLKLFGLESITSADALIRNAGKVETLTEKLTGTNTAYDQARTKVNNFRGDMKGLWSSFERLQIIVGSKILPRLRDFAVVVRNGIRSLGDMAKGSTSIEEIFDKLVLGVIMFALAVSDVVRKVVPSLDDIKLAFIGIAETALKAQKIITEIEDFFGGDDIQADKAIARINGQLDALAQKRDAIGAGEDKPLFDFSGGGNLAKRAREITDGFEAAGAAARKSAADVASGAEDSLGSAADSSIALAEQHRETYGALMDVARDQGITSTEEAVAQLETMGGQFGAKMSEWTSTFGTFAEEMSTVMVDTLKMGVDSISAAFGNMLTSGKSLGEAFSNVVKQMVGAIIGGLIKIGLQRAIQAIFGKTILAAETAASVISAGIVAAAWAPAAAAVSLATLGANSAPAIAGITATHGVSQALSAATIPAAHGGLDFVPKESTFLLDKGERVLSPNQNRDLTSFLAGGGGGAGGTTTITVENLTVESPAGSSPEETRNWVANVMIPALDDLNREGVKPEFVSSSRGNV